MSRDIMPHKRVITVGPVAKENVFANVSVDRKQIEQLPLMRRECHFNSTATGDVSLDVEHCCRFTRELAFSIQLRAAFGLCGSRLAIEWLFASDLECGDTWS